MSSADTDGRREQLRRTVLTTAAILTVVSLLHHVDHAVRGQIVVAEGLPEAWNHSGWPFQERVTPFTASLAIYLVIAGGFVATLRRRAWAAYWLGSSIVLGAVVALVHFVPGAQTETPRVIWRTYGGGVAGTLAVIDLAVLVGGLLFVAAESVYVRRATGRW